MEKENILSIENILSAYEISGLKPKQGSYFPAEGCACALGAVANVNGIRNNDSIQTYYFWLNTIGDDALNAFADGFDNKSFFADDRDILDDKLKKIYEDGKAAWEAVKHLAD
jgi:hypothetical protein